MYRDRLSLLRWGRRFADEQERCATTSRVAPDPGEGDAQPVSQPGDVEAVQECPEEVREASADAEAAALDDRGVPSDHRGHALVPIVEGSRRLPSHVPDDFAGGVAAALDRELRERRMEPAIARGKRGHVSDRKHLAVAGKAQVRADTNSPAGRLRDAERVRERRRPNACRPDDGAGRDLAAVAERDRGRPDVDDLRAEPHVGAALAQHPQRRPLEPGMEGGKQRVPGFDDGDLRLREVELGELVPECVVVDLGEGRRHLDAGGAAADDDHVERPSRNELRMGSRSLEPAEQVIPDPERVIERLQREGVSRGSRNALDVRVETGREDQVVEGQPLPVREHELVPVEVGDHRSRQPDASVPLAAKQAADRVRNVLHVRHPARDLVDQRLEDVVVASVDEGHLDGGARELPRGLDAAHAAADDHHARRSAFVRAHRRSPAIAPAISRAVVAGCSGEDSHFPFLCVASTRAVRVARQVSAMANTTSHS